ALENFGCTGFEAETGAAARQHASEPDVVIPLLWALVYARTSEADRILEDFSRSQETDLRRAAEFTLIARHPPVAGVFVRTLKGDDDSGLEAWDIITALDGRPVSRTDDLDSVLRTTPSER